MGRKALFILLVLTLVALPVIAACAGPAPAPATAPATQKGPAVVAGVGVPGEVDEAAFALNFTEIYLAQIPKPGESPSTTPVTAFDTTEAGINVRVFTTPDMEPGIKLSVRIYDITTGGLIYARLFKPTLEPSQGHDEELKMEALKGATGKLEMKFYVSSNLVRLINFEVK